MINLTVGCSFGSTVVQTERDLFNAELDEIFPKFSNLDAFSDSKDVVRIHKGWF